MKKSYIVLSLIIFLMFNCIVAFSQLGGIGSYDFYGNSSKFILQRNQDNLSDNNTINTVLSNLGNLSDNSSSNIIQSNLRNDVNDNITENPNSNINNISNNNTNVNVSSNFDNYQWLERVVVSDYEPDAGDTITIEGYGWNPNNYSNGIEITLSGGGGSDLRIGRIVPDNEGYFKIKYKLPKSYKYNDIIEIRCNGEAVALLQIKD